MNLSETMRRLDDIDAQLLRLSQQVRSIKATLTAEVDLSSTLEPQLSAEQVAKVLGLQVTNVYGLARAGKLPGRKIGKYWRFSPDQIKRWIERKSLSHDQEHDIIIS